MGLYTYGDANSIQYIFHKILKTTKNTSQMYKFWQQPLESLAKTLKNWLQTKVAKTKTLLDIPSAQ